MQSSGGSCLPACSNGVAQIAFLYNSEHQGGPPYNGIGFSTSSPDLENTLKAFLKPDSLEASSQLSFPISHDYRLCLVDINPASTIPNILGINWYVRNSGCHDAVSAYVKDEHCLYLGKYIHPSIWTWLAGQWAFWICLSLPHNVGVV